MLEMNLIKNSNFKLIAIFVGIFVGLLIGTYVFLYYSWIIDPRYTLEEMDLDSSGLVSYSEADYVTNSGERKIVVSGKSCIEYFAYKDGLPIKTVCNETNL